MRVTATRSRRANLAERAPPLNLGVKEPAVSLPRQETLEQSVVRSLDRYFSDLDGARPHALHELVMQAVERPLLKFAVDRCAGNQSAAADLLGINRNTLRRKLVDYGLL
ncbi:MAG: Fis family transcriptional regulator [Betaproteobacteria bacterium]|jgi:Fis family transcriptional regulator|nr:MAG: Fis family transcriptional regulator [Betaproteobacteria bacterium]